MYLEIFATSIGTFTKLQDYIKPTVELICSIALLVSVFCIVYSGIIYITSRGNPDNLQRAKHILLNSLVGIVIIIGSFSLTQIITKALPNNASSSKQTVINIKNIKPATVDNGLGDIFVTLANSLISSIIQTVASPFLSTINDLTSSTSLMSQNKSVFNLWLAMTIIGDTLFALIIALVGFHVISSDVFGLEQIDMKHLLPRILLAFLLSNVSIFIIDGIIEFSNILISTVNQIDGGVTIWQMLDQSITNISGQSLAALLIMLILIILTIILCIYYVGRLVLLFLGAVISPLVILLSLLPSCRDFVKSTARFYIITIFILFVHVIILKLASSLLGNISSPDSGTFVTSAILGLATVLLLLRTQGILMHISYASMGVHSAHELGNKIINAATYLTTKTTNVTSKGKALSYYGANNTQTIPQFNKLNSYRTFYTASKNTNQVNKPKNESAQSTSRSAQINKDQIIKDKKEDKK